ncbi:TPA: hypothetical protein ACRZ4F_005484 [Vibrio harveyi]
MAQQNSTLTLPKCQTATNVSPLEHESPPKNDVSWRLLELPMHLDASKVVSVVLRREHFGSWETPREQWVEGFQLMAVMAAGTERHIKNFMPSQRSVAEIKHECDEIAKALKVTLVDKSLGFGFTVAQNSNITPEQLKAAGFTMRDFKFYPSDFEEVKKRLCNDFIVCDESTPTQAVFGFYHYPF